MIEKDTKIIIANSFKKLVNKKPIEKITVSDITKEANISRQTFYRHFLDKYDLMNWYFDKILLESFDHMGEGRTLYECLYKKFVFIKEERLFFKEAFRLDDKNCLKDHDFELIYDFYAKRINEKGHHELDDDIKFLLEMYCNGSIFMTVKWVMNDCLEDPSIIVNNLIDAMPPKLKEVFLNLKLI